MVLKCMMSMTAAREFFCEGQGKNLDPARTFDPDARAKTLSLPPFSLVPTSL